MTFTEFVVAPDLIHKKLEQKQSEFEVLQKKSDFEVLEKKKEISDL